MQLSVSASLSMVISQDPGCPKNSSSFFKEVLCPERVLNAFSEFETAVLLPAVGPVTVSKYFPAQLFPCMLILTYIDKTELFVYSKTHLVAFCNRNRHNII